MKKLIVAVLLLFAATAHAQIVNTLPFQLQNGTTADASQVMANFNQIVDNVNAGAAKNGTNSDITALTGLTTPLSPTQGGTTVYAGGTSTGAANAQVVSTLVPAGFTLAAGKRVVFIAGFTNTGALTLNLNAVGAKNVYYPTPSGPAALVGGEVTAGNIVEVYYDGTQYQLITNNLAVLGPLTDVASATTTDLGAVATHNVNITGTTGITAFGSSASTNYPIYYLTFGGALTITYDASALIVPGAADITTVAGDTAVAQYLGSGNWKIWSYQRVSGTSVVAPGAVCGANGFRMTNNSSTPTTSIDVTWRSAVATNSSNVSIINTTATTVTLNSTSSGAVNQWDGTRPTSGWGNIFIISNGASWGVLGSASATAPSMPAGYTYKCRVGATWFDGSQNLRRFQQSGSWTQNKPVSAANPVIASGTAGVSCGSGSSGTLESVSVANYVPPTATEIAIIAATTYNGVGAASNVQVAPSGDYGSFTTTKPPPLLVRGGSVGDYAASVRFLLEGTTVWWCSSAGGGAIQALGWRDDVNVN